MASSAGHRNPKCHVLNFFYDDEEGCALTVLLNEIRFHIIADAKRLQTKDGPGSKAARAFRKLLRAVRHQDQNFTRPSSKDNLRSSPVEGSRDSGQGTSDDDEVEEEDDRDSAVDVGEHSTKSKELSNQGDTTEDPEQALNNWMLQPFGSIFEDKAPHCKAQQNQSISEWYERVTYCYSLCHQDGKLKAIEEETSEDLEHRMKNIVPKLTMPKYVRNLDIPWYPAKDVIVLDSSDDPAPYGPRRVRIGNETFFLKTVDPMQPQPTKREISIMKRIEKLELHKKMHVPLVKGLVGYEDSHTDIIGFLQTAIEDPTPLTSLLDEDVPQSKRDKWATESERIIGLLHDNDIIWGDAKADNFMVDKNDDLWIIDFGGSYTDGWVDPELSESLEGDDMGLDKIVNALHDPLANTFDANEDETLYQEPSASPVNRKRKAGEDDDDVCETNEPTTKSSPNKRVRIEKHTESEATEEDIDREEQDGSDTTNDDKADEEMQLCICNQPASGDMVGCDNNDCARQWFHFECVGLKGPPEADEWYCDDCRG